mmetsp:Transcript_2978/g.8155  ORF Transcript_2978/g.8155 Transcript_2978/m.8155 type:complete len:85 (-) Transcript_2978:706-960(-)
MQWVRAMGGVLFGIHHSVVRSGTVRCARLHEPESSVVLCSHGIKGNSNQRREGNNTGTNQQAEGTENSDSNGIAFTLNNIAIVH